MATTRAPKYPTPVDDIDTDLMDDGIEAMTGKFEARTAGPLNLPEGFNTTAYSAKWEFEGNRIAMAQQSEMFPREGKKAPGWEVWKDPNTKEKISRPLSSGTVVLLFRKKATQAAVNKLYAAESVRRVNNEVGGQTALGEGSVEGILTKEHLGNDPADLETGPMPSAVFGNPNEEDALQLD